MSKLFMVLVALWAIFFQSGICLAQVATPAPSLPLFDFASIWAQIQMWLEVTSQLALAIMIVATILLRIIPSKYRASVEGVMGKLMTFIHWLPTLGMNPRTKDLENTLIELKKQLPEEKTALVEPKV